MQAMGGTRCIYREMQIAESSLDNFVIVQVVGLKAKGKKKTKKEKKL